MDTNKQDPHDSEQPQEERIEDEIQKDEQNISIQNSSFEEPEDVKMEILENENETKLKNEKKENSENQLMISAPQKEITKNISIEILRIGETDVTFLVSPSILENIGLAVEPSRMYNYRPAEWSPLIKEFHPRTDPLVSVYYLPVASTSEIVAVTYPITSSDNPTSVEKLLPPKIAQWSKQLNEEELSQQITSVALSDTPVYPNKDRVPKPTLLTLLDALHSDIVTTAKQRSLIRLIVFEFLGNEISLARLYSHLGQIVGYTTLHGIVRAIISAQKKPTIANQPEKNLRAESRTMFDRVDEAYGLSRPFSTLSAPSSLISGYPTPSYLFINETERNKFYNFNLNSTQNQSSVPPYYSTFSASNPSPLWIDIPIGRTPMHRISHKHLDLGNVLLAVGGEIKSDTASNRNGFKLITITNKLDFRWQTYSTAGDIPSVAYGCSLHLFSPNNSEKENVEVVAFGGVTKFANFNFGVHSNRKGVSSSSEENNKNNSESSFYDEDNQNSGSESEAGLKNIIIENVEFSSDLYILNLETKLWKKIVPIDNIKPTARAFANSFLIKDPSDQKTIGLFIFGGMCKRRDLKQNGSPLESTDDLLSSLSDVWIFDFSNLTWSCLPITIDNNFNNNIKCNNEDFVVSRFGAADALISPNVILIHGGAHVLSSKEMRYVNDSWTFEVILKDKLINKDKDNDCNKSLKSKLSIVARRIPIRMGSENGISVGRVFHSIFILKIQIDDISEIQVSKMNENIFKNSESQKMTKWTLCIIGGINACMSNQNQLSEYYSFHLFDFEIENSSFSKNCTLLFNKSIQPAVRPFSPLDTPPGPPPTIFESLIFINTTIPFPSMRKSPSLPALYLSGGMSLGLGIENSSTDNLINTSENHIDDQKDNFESRDDGQQENKTRKIDSNMIVDSSISEEINIIDDDKNKNDKIINSSLSDIIDPHPLWWSWWLITFHSIDPFDLKWSPLPNITAVKQDEQINRQPITPSDKKTQKIENSNISTKDIRFENDENLEPSTLLSHGSCTRLKSKSSSEIKLVTKSLTDFVKRNPPWLVSPNFTPGIFSSLGSQTTWAFSAVGHLLHNSSALSTNSTHICAEFGTGVNNQPYFSFTDNGRGLSYAGVHKLLKKFGLQSLHTKSVMHHSYGMGFKMSVSRLSESVLVITKTRGTVGIGILSSQMLTDSDSQLLSCPVSFWSLPERRLIIGDSDSSSNHQALIQNLLFSFSPFKSPQWLAEQINSISKTGTRIIFYSFKTNFSNHLTIRYSDANIVLNTLSCLNQDSFNDDTRNINNKNKNKNKNDNFDYIPPVEIGNGFGSLRQSGSSSLLSANLIKEIENINRIKDSREEFLDVNIYKNIVDKEIDEMQNGINKNSSFDSRKSDVLKERVNSFILNEMNINKNNYLKINNNNKLCLSQLSTISNSEEIYSLRIVSSDLKNFSSFLSPGEIETCPSYLLDRSQNSILLSEELIESEINRSLEDSENNKSENNNIEISVSDESVDDNKNEIKNQKLEIIDMNKNISENKNDSFLESSFPFWTSSNNSIDYSLSTYLYWAQLFNSSVVWSSGIPLIPSGDEIINDNNIKNNNNSELIISGRKELCQQKESSIESVPFEDGDKISNSKEFYKINEKQSHDISVDSEIITPPVMPSESTTNLFSAKNKNSEIGSRKRRRSRWAKDLDPSTDQNLTAEQIDTAVELTEKDSQTRNEMPRSPFSRSLGRYLLSHLNARVELDYLFHPEDAQHGCYGIIGFANPLSSLIFKNDNNNKLDVHETGILLYHNERLIRRLFVPFPADPNLLNEIAGSKYPESHFNGRPNFMFPCTAVICVPDWMHPTSSAENFIIDKSPIFNDFVFKIKQLINNYLTVCLNADLLARWKQQRADCLLSYLSTKHPLNSLYHIVVMATIAKQNQQLISSSKEKEKERNVSTPQDEISNKIEINNNLINENNNLNSRGALGGVDTSSSMAAENSKRQKIL